MTASNPGGIGRARPLFVSSISFSLLVVTSLLLSPLPARGEDGDEAGPAAEAKKVVFEGPSGMDFRTHAILGTSVGEDDAYGHLEFLHPLWSDENSLLFLYPRLGLSSDVDPGFSLGAGMRHYLEGMDAILGYNMHYDRYEGRGGNYFDQLGLGAEVLSRWVDGRFNFYLPEGEGAVAGSRTSTSTSTATSFGDPFGQHYTIRQPVTTTRTTTTRTFEQFEEAMRGYDWEIGFLTPGLDQYVDLRLFIGTYGYENPFGEDLDGVKARAELRMSSKLAFDATYYEDEEVRGDNWVFGMRVNIPIYPENLDHGGSPFAGSFDGLFDGVNRGGGIGGGKSAMASASKVGSAASYVTAHDRFNPLSRIVAGASHAGVFDRMTEEILRDPSIKSSLSDFIENVEKRDIDRIVTREIVVVDPSVVFVDSSRGAGGNGTFERPHNTIQKGVNKAARRFGNQGDVVVHGSPKYTENVVDAGKGVRIWGGGVGVPVLGGKRFHYGNTPILIGGFDVDGIPHFTLSGFGIRGGFFGGDGVNVFDIGDVVISHSTISNVGSDGIDITTNRRSNIRVANNLVQNAGDNGLELDIDSDGDDVRATIANNRFLGNGSDGIEVDADFDNRNSSVDLIVVHNLSRNNGDHGFDLDLDGDGSGVGVNRNQMTSAVISGNRFVGNGDDGLNLEIDTDNGARTKVFVGGNVFEQNSDNGLEFDLNTDDGLTWATVTGNFFLRNGGIGLDVEVDSDSEDRTVFDFVATLNRVFGNKADGIQVDQDSNGPGKFFYRIDNNHIQKNSDDGLDIHIDADDNATVSFGISGNTFLNNRSDSLEVRAHLAAKRVTTFFSTLDNTSFGAGGDNFNDDDTSDSRGFILLNGRTIRFPSPGDSP